jgi:L-serine deaminase
VVHIIGDFSSLISYLHFTEVMELHSRTEVQKHVGQVRTLVGQLVEHGVGDHLDGKLNVPQRRSKTMAEKLLDFNNNCLFGVCEDRCYATG